MPLAELELEGTDSIIGGGGESGPPFRTIDPVWARDLRDRSVDAGVPFYYKQSAALNTETDTLLDGKEFRQLDIHEFKLSEATGTTRQSSESLTVHRKAV